MTTRGPGRPSAETTGPPTAGRRLPGVAGGGDEDRLTGQAPTLYVSDLDGTLLTPQGRIGAVTAGILRGLLAEGVLVTYATSRSWATTERLVGDLRSRAPIILHNGAVTFDPVAGAVLAHATIPGNAVASVLATCRRRQVVPLVHGIEDGRERVSWVEDGGDPGISAFWEDRPDDPRRSPRQTWASLPTIDVTGISVIGSRAAVVAAAAEIEATAVGACEVAIRADTYRREWTWLEVLGRGVSKGAAVRRVAERVGASRTVVFGDNTNDLEMFAVADEAYAVANAVEDVRRAARAVIGANDEDGVASWLAAHARPGTR